MSLAVWDTNTGEPIGVPAHMTLVTSAAFSPDSHHLAYNYNKDIGVTIIDVLTGRTVQEMPILGTPRSIAYGADGKQILVAGDKTIMVLDAESGHYDAEMTDSRGSIDSAMFSADGKYIIESARDGVRVWDATTHLAIGDFEGRNMNGGDIEISDDNRRILANGLPSGRLWPGPAAWPDLLCGKLTQNMSQKEWDEWVEPSIPYESACPDLPKAADTTS